jgi:glycosyltransferase involved in cell wall biosynthesis
MRVCFVSHSFGNQGAERALLETVEVLRPEGVRPFVIVPRRGWLSRELQARDIPYQVLPYIWWMGRHRSAWRTAVKLLAHSVTLMPVVAAIWRWKPHLVISNSITVGTGAVAARILGYPHIWFIHEFGREHHGLNFDFGDRRSLHLADQLSIAFVVPSRVVAERFGEYVQCSKIRVVPQALSLFDPPPVPRAPGAGPLRSVMIGALQQAKGQIDAIRAIALAVTKGVDAYLTIVGEGEAEYHRALTTLITELELTKRVRLVGYSETIAEYLAAADVVLVCSRFESFGRATVEAMLAGRPVIGARSGSTAELIRDGYNGVLYEHGNVADLAEKIASLANDRYSAWEMGLRAHEWAADRFSRQRYSRDLLQLIRTVVPIQVERNSP